MPYNNAEKDPEAYDCCFSDITIGNCQMNNPIFFNRGYELVNDLCVALQDVVRIIVKQSNVDYLFGFKHSAPHKVRKIRLWPANNDYSYTLGIHCLDQKPIFTPGCELCIDVLGSDGELYFNDEKHKDYGPYPLDDLYQIKYNHSP